MFEGQPQQVPEPPITMVIECNKTLAQDDGDALRTNAWTNNFQPIKLKKGDIADLEAIGIDPNSDEGAQYIATREIFAEKELERNFYKKAFNQYDAWTRVETLSTVRMIDMHSERIGDMFSFTNR